MKKVFQGEKVKSKKFEKREKREKLKKMVLMKKKELKMT